MTELAVPPEVAFDLSLDVDLHAGSMAASREVAVAGVMRGRMRLNEEVTWRAWHFGVPWRMTSRITALERPGRFVDEQVRGPFARFRHEHVFETSARGTRMIDRVEFAAPLGPLGRVAERLVLGRYMKHLIETRNAYIKAAAAAHRSDGDDR